MSVFLCKSKAWAAVTEVANFTAAMTAEDKNGFSFGSFAHIPSLGDFCNQLKRTQEGQELEKKRGFIQV